MPTILDLFKQANGNKDVTTWNGGHKNKGLGGKIMDFVKAEANPNGPRVLFYKKLVTPPLIYGTETPRISLKGTVDPARSLATKSAKYAGDPKAAGAKPPLLNLGSLLGGSANRPSDTIFASELGSPVTVGTLPTQVGDHTGLKYAVEAGTDYLISKVPMGPNALSGVLKGNLNQIGTKAIGAGIGAAKKAIGNAITKTLTKNRKQNRTQQGNIGTKQGNAGELYAGGVKSGNGDATKGNVKNSEYFTTYTATTNQFTNRIQYVADKAQERKSDSGYVSLDSFNQNILQNGIIFNDNELDGRLNNSKLGATFIKIKPYGKNYTLLFPAAISGISEDVSPEWSNFKYLGSPFNVYRYQGVERSLKFEFKLYYTDDASKLSMISNLNSLKELTFPFNEVSHIKYANNQDVALAFSPNLIELSINGLYEKIFGFIDSLSFSIDDNTSWSTTDPNMVGNGASNQLYPSVINVSFSMKIIENPQLDNHLTKPDTKVYRYNFDGLTFNTANVRAETKELEQKIKEDINAKIRQEQLTYNDPVVAPEGV
jgi:hypothetical protein